MTAANLDQAIDLVNRIDYKKGPYFADEGDFSSAGAALAFPFIACSRKTESGVPPGILQDAGSELGHRLRERAALPPPSEVRDIPIIARGRILLPQGDDAVTFAGRGGARPGRQCRQGRRRAGRRARRRNRDNRARGRHRASAWVAHP